MREALRLVVWLHTERLTLAELCQHQVDAWLAAGATTRRVVRPFPAWLERTAAGRALEVP